ncbi:PDGLE domain-containing protein [Methanobrevibacter filiformis]|uniref:Cobalt transport protein CbiN n=1 Tax=Methanobrevibacter filiformis TaxID=55758 RepID=A0A165YZX9_9EURY|nr:PDGLE domain-containing protein [Methanobrevibacter filiformis]KZX10074.1 cobalt transport protein CbiN [Methanobrevibacter filiformis]
MNSKNKKFLVIGIIIAIVIAALAPFLASSNPDGLESATEKLNPQALEIEPVHESPMPDYMIPSFGESPISGSIAIIIGVIIVFALAYTAGIVLKRRN